MLLAAAVVSIAAAAAGAWLLSHRDRVEASTVADAVKRYRDLARGGETSIPAGVYRYRTTGFESVSALGGARHTYPRQSTVTVTPGACGMELRWDVLQGRHTTWQVCGPEGGGLVAGDWEDLHTFFSSADLSRWECSPGPWLPTADAIGTTTSRLCDNGITKLAGELQVVGATTLAVGGAPVDVVHTRFQGEEDGVAKGTLREERWLERETGLPVRLVYRVTTKNRSPIGNVDFEERYQLQLLSFEAVR